MLIKQNLQTDFCYETFHTSCTQPVGQSPGGRGCLIKINMIQKTWRENIDDININLKIKILPQFYFHIQPMLTISTSVCLLIWRNMKEDESDLVGNESTLNWCLFRPWKEGLTRLTVRKSDKDLLFKVSASRKVSFDMRKPFYAFCNSKNLKSQINVKGHIFISIPAPDDTDCCS